MLTMSNPSSITHSTQVRTTAPSDRLRIWLTPARETPLLTFKERLRRYAFTLIPLSIALFAVMLITNNYSVGAAAFVLASDITLYLLLSPLAISQMREPGINLNEYRELSILLANTTLFSFMATTWFDPNSPYVHDLLFMLIVPLANVTTYVLLVLHRYTRAALVTFAAFTYLMLWHQGYFLGSFGLREPYMSPAYDLSGIVTTMLSLLVPLVLSVTLFRSMRSVILAEILATLLALAGIATHRLTDAPGAEFILSATIIYVLVFVAMLAGFGNELIRRESALTGLINTLEQRVAERTAELQIAKEDADRANKVKSTFLASMSHELRTPLNAVINFSKMLERGAVGEVNAGQAELLSLIAQSGEHLLNLINDVLDMSKIESGNLNLYVESGIDICELLETGIHYTAPLRSAKTIAVLRDFPDTLPALNGDRRRLLQIFLNILSNASKFTARGSITVIVRSDSTHVRVSIQDTGCGIAPEDRQNVFTAFTQTKSGIRHGGGTGLGMAICQRLVQAHEGDIRFTSELGVGTTFYVDLPIESSLHPEET